MPAEISRGAPRPKDNPRQTQLKLRERREREAEGRRAHAPGSPDVIVQDECRRPYWPGDPPRLPRLELAALLVELHFSKKSSPLRTRIAANGARCYRLRI